MNEVLERLPKHLLDLVIDQPYNEYTAQDHALWRYVMRQNVRYLSNFAHGSYIDGLRLTGVSIDHIPHMYGMNRILREIGWAAVAVDGFIPPSAFMEFQAYNVLVIAADIRPIGQIEYTPAPDIIHEAAGHAPIIANPEYSEYLRLFGEIGSKAFSSAADHRLYEAIRHLSILKADPYTPADLILSAELRLKESEKEVVELSEMTLIRNLHWWTVEYGLIGDLNKPKIYGAGLLSSIGESIHSLKDSVRKIPYTIEAQNYTFDITKMQPQLFVTPDFAHLTEVLKDFEQQMALRRGGIYGLKKTIASENHATCVYSSGLQISGIFSSYTAFEGQVAYISTTGPTTLNFRNKQLPGHGKEHHIHGFGSPAGKLKDVNKLLEDNSESELRAIGIEKNKPARLFFESGISVQGIPFHLHFEEGKLLLISFRECTVTNGNDILFNPGWGAYDMAVGASIVSCYNGPADPDAYGLRFPVPEEKTHKIIHEEKHKKLFGLYQNVRDLREANAERADLTGMFDILARDYPDDWLLPVEILEYARKTTDSASQEKAFAYLENLKARLPVVAHLIDNGYLL